MRITPCGRDDLMAVAAVRYCIGRTSYIVGDCRAWLFAVWPDLSDGARKLIRDSVEEAFVQDERTRQSHPLTCALGWNCDREEWEKVRMLWKGDGK